MLHPKAAIADRIPSVASRMADRVFEAAED
jgi:hypothetical protein